MEVLVGNFETEKPYPFLWGLNTFSVQGCLALLFTTLTNWPFQVLMVLIVPLERYDEHSSNIYMQGSSPDLESTVKCQ